MNSTANSSAEPSAFQGASRIRSSEVLRGILTKNPGVKRFSVARIMKAIGSDKLEASLMMFSIPAIVPVPGPRGIVVGPTGALACQLVSGHNQIKLPRFISRQQVSRRSIAVAIHAILPILEAAERLVRPRWSWLCHPYARRAIGVLVFLLAVAIASPLSGFSTLHALSIFAVSLGLAEQDGLAILIGIVAGVVSLAIVAASGVSARVLHAKALRMLRKFAKKIGLNACASFLDRLGYTQLARVLTFQWSDLLMLWDPEKPIPAPRSARQSTSEPPMLPVGGSGEAIELPGLTSVDDSRACVGEQAGV